MTTLTECQPHFVRCVKPNAAGKPGRWEAGYVLEQLRAGGVLEAVRIAVAGAHPVTGNLGSSSPLPPL